MKIRELPAITKVGLQAAWYSKNAFISRSLLNDYRDKMLKKAVALAYHETEFYRKKFDDCGVRPGDIRSIDDLPKLPIVTKQELIDHFEAAIPKSLNTQRAFLMGTSGSTGKPIRIYKDYQWLAHVTSATLREGVIHRFGFPKIASIVDISSPYNFESTVGNYSKALLFRMKEISVEQDVAGIMKTLEEFRPTAVFTYTGIMRELATLKNNGRGSRLNIKIVWTTGEILDDFTRSYIEEAFHCKCYSKYSSTEAAHVALECPQKKMHINSDTVTVEIVDQQGNVLPRGKEGRIVLTCHDGGRGTPIIRYSGCSDVGYLSDERCSCGLKTPVLGRILGRQVDSIHLPDGRVYHAFALIDPMGDIQRREAAGLIRQYQIVQEDLHNITFSLLLNEERTESAEDFRRLKKVIEEDYTKLLGPDIHLTVKKVNAIPRGTNAAAPVPLVISKIRKENLKKI